MKGNKIVLTERHYTHSVNLILDLLEQRKKKMKWV